MNFRQTLAAAWQRNDSLLCVGLDPDPVKFPAHFAGQPDAISAAPVRPVAGPRAPPSP